MTVVLVEAVPILPVSVVTVEADGVFADVALPPLPAAIVVGSGDVTEAPTDGSTYGRKNGSWTAVLPLTGGFVVGDVTATRFFATSNVFIGGTTDNGYQLDVTGGGHLSTKLLVGDLLPGPSIAANASLTVNTSGANPHAALLYYGTASTPQYWGLAAGGTSGAPVSLVLDQAIAAFGGAGFDGNVFSTTADAQISLCAAENWTGTAHGSYIQVSGKVTGTNALNEWARFKNGNLLIGTITDRGYRLDVSGAAGVRFDGARFDTDGGTTSSVTITAQGTGVVLPAPPLNTYLRIAGANAAIPRLLLDSFGTYSQTTARASGGTAAAPTALAANANIHVMGGVGYDGTVYSVNQITQIAATDGVWTATSHPTRWTFSTTPVNSVTVAVEAMRITSAGNLLIGTPTDAGYKLDVNGTGRFGAGAGNALTITPGATAASAIAFSQSGTGGISLPQITGNLSIMADQINMLATPTYNVIIGTSDSSDNFGGTGGLVLSGGKNTGGGSPGPVSLTTGSATTTGNANGANLTITLGAGFGTGKAGNLVVTNASGTPNKLTITPGAAAADISLTASGPGGVSLVTPLAAGLLTAISAFAITAGGTLTANTSNITTAVTVSGGAPFSAGTISSDNTGLVAAQTVLHGSPAPVTVGGAFTVLWNTALGFYTATMTVVSSVVSGTTRTVSASGTVAGGNVGYVPNGISYIAVYTQPGGAGTTISATYNIATDSALPWARFNAVGTTIYSPLAVGVPGVNNALTITPGAATTNPVVFTQSGSGGFTLPATTIAGSLSATGSFSTASPGAPKTAATYTIAAADTALLLAPTATMTLTLPAAASSGGRMLWLKLTTAFAVNSASANVVPLAGGAASAAILAATAGKVCLLQSDGTNWQLMNAN